MFAPYNARVGRGSRGFAILATGLFILHAAAQPAAAQRSVSVGGGAGGFVGNVPTWWTDQRQPAGCSVEFQFDFGKDLPFYFPPGPRGLAEVINKLPGLFGQDTFYPPNYVPVGRIIFPRGHPRCAAMSGDPHATTFDDVRYDLQAAGEFVGIRSLDDDFEVQYRLVPYGGNVSYTTAVAARLADRRVMIAARTDTPLRIEGEPVELADGRYLHNMDVGVAIARTGRRYTLVWPDRTNVHVDVFGHYINVYVLVSAPRDGRLVGLFGDADGDGANDFRARDGSALASPPDFESLYKVFAESWRVSPGESLFTYGPGESTETFTKRSQPVRLVTLDDLDAADRARAEERCRAAGVVEREALDECVFDVGFTGDEAFIESALSLQTPPQLRSDEPGRSVIASGWTSSYGPMRFEQTGDMMVGSYENGVSQITGTIRDGVLEGIWYKPRTARQCATERMGTRYWGQLRFTFVSEDRFEGVWEYCDAEPRIRWNGTRESGG